MLRIMPAVRMTAVAVALVSFAALPASAGTWKGSEATEEGVLVVKNPGEPVNAPTTVKLEELWRIGGETDSEEEFFGVISRIMADEEGNVYLLDSQLSEIKVFSGEGAYLRTLGREGEGPGEFRTPSDAFFTPDGNIGVLQPFPSKIVLLAKDGTPSGELPLPAVDGFRILQRAMPGKDRLYVHEFVQVLGEGQADLNFRLAAIDKDGKEVQEYIKEKRVFDFANAVIAESVYDTFDRRWLAAPDGRLMVGITHAEYKIKVWGPDGSLDRLITREYKHRARSAEEKATIHSIYQAFTRNAPNAKVEVNDNDPDLQNLYVREDGSLWVMTSHGLYDAPKGSLGVFDVFDRKGRFVQQVTLQGDGDPENDGFFFVDDRIYVVTDFLSAAMALQGGSDAEFEEDAEPMAVICHRLDVPDFGASSEE